MNAHIHPPPDRASAGCPVSYHQVHREKLGHEGRQAGLNPDGGALWPLCFPGGFAAATHRHRGDRAFAGKDIEQPHGSNQ